jgi:hypothetical protein
LCRSCPEIANAIGKAARPPQPNSEPLDVVLHGACALAAAAKQELDLVAAWAALPERVPTRSVPPAARPMLL